MDPARKKKWSNRLFTWLITAMAVFVATSLVPGIQAKTPESLFIAAILLSLAHEFVRPYLLLLSLPLLLLTLMFFRLIINAMLLGIVAYLVPDFEITGFWSAFFGALIISVITMMLAPARPPQTQANPFPNLNPSPPPPRRDEPKRYDKDDSGGPIIDV